MALNLQKYENQAKLSVILAIVGGAAALAAIALLLRNFDTGDRYVYYRATGLWFPALGASLAMALLTSTAAFFLGLASASKRRNTATGVSWTGFFLSAITITVTLSAALFFIFTRSPVR